MSGIKKTKKDKQVLMLANVAHILNFIPKKAAGEVLRQYKKIGEEFDPLQYMLDGKLINELNVITLKKILYAFETIQEDTRFGALCISFMFLTESNLELALQEQKLLIEQGKDIKLGDILVEAGMISNGQCQLILIKQKMNIKAAEELAKKRNEIGGKEPSPQINKKNMREIKNDNLIFLIQNDALKAYLGKTELFDPSTSLEKLKELITNQKIAHGVAKDDQLQEFLDSEEYSKDNFFLLARGDAPVHGVDATEKIYFEEEYKAAGKVGIDGSIDYKERGTVPTVKAGDLLAEKVPAKEGEVGLNVFDEILPAEVPKETFLKYGTGTRISEDGLKIYAEVNGYPKKEATDEIIVNEIFVIDGDVDYRTGHVSYDKSVNISGSIKNGFKVSAIDIVVDEVDGGILHAKGNIVVRKGIIDAEVKAKGKITASFISRSKVSCFGDIVVVKEISDSEIFSDGTCRVRVGKVYASTITAKRGANIRSVGAEKAKRVVLIVGTSPNYDKKLDKIDKLIENKQNKLEEITYEKNSAQNELKEIVSIISNLSSSIEKTQAMLKKLDGDNKDGKKMMEESIVVKTEKLEKLETQKQELENKFQEAKEAELICSKTVRDTVKEKFLLKKTNQDNPPRPVVKVEGALVAGTLIQGKYSKIIVNEHKNRVRITEIQSFGNDLQTKNSYGMVISDL
ncbi:MAG: DUF342 domain-containing protein [Desulfobacterales bacterium]|nr:DUF342 domain-containing protein [Desulfobacterales bacterium]